MNIQNLIDAASPGDIVNIPPGIYNEQIIIDKPLTLQGPFTGGSAVIDATGLVAAPTIEILSSDVSVKNLTIQNGQLHGIQVGSVASADLIRITISDNYIKGHSNAGILTNHGASMTIENNYITNNGLGTGFNRGGIVLYPHGMTKIINNSISNDLPNNSTDGIFARGSSTGLLIQNNVIENYPNSRITLAWDESNVRVIDNVIKKCGIGSFDEQGGLVIIQSVAEIITGNTVEDCSRSGIFWGWVLTTGSQPDEILIANNRISNSSRDAIYLFSQAPGGFIPADIFPLEPIIRGNTLSSSGRAGIYVSNVYYYGPGNARPTINDNIITGNEWGVLNATDQIINAVENWWGNSSGPYHPLLNPDGTGNQVSDRVDFIPWITEAPKVEIIKCLISNVQMEHYEISPLTDQTSNVDLTIKVSGNVDINFNGEIISLDFTKRFAKRLIMIVPDSDIDAPIIASNSACCASLINGNSIRIEIQLYLTVDIGGKRNILIRASDHCSPRQKIVNPDSPIDNLPDHCCKGNDPCFMECIRAEVIFSRCQFKKTLLHYIEMPQLF
mgnify:CR=1 FL=1